MDKVKKVADVVEDDAAPSPASAFSVFVVMEDLIDKLKLLDYESQFVKEFNTKLLSKHYFAIGTNAGEQFYMFVIVASWLIRKANKPFDTPQQSDDPNATVASILDHVRKSGISLDFPPNRLKQGHGEAVVFVLDRLADLALKSTNFSWQQPVINEEEEYVEEENGSDDELDLDQVEEEMAAQYGTDDEDYDDVDDIFNVNVPPTSSTMMTMPTMFESNVADADAWKLELERVIPRLKLAMKPDSRDWRSRLDMLWAYSTNVSSSISNSQSYLKQMSSDIEKNMERIETREKYLNSQLSLLLDRYSKKQQELQQVDTNYRNASVGVEERNIKLGHLNEEIQHVKNELDERTSNMSDGTPLVNLKKVLVRMKAELATMDVRIGVVSHVILQTRLKQSTALQHLLLANSTLIAQSKLST